MKPSLDAIFRPRSIAVVGASTRKGTLGREIFDKLLAADFNGPVYPVHPKAEFVHSVKAYKSVSAIPDSVELAVIVVRKELVLDVVKECARCGVKGVVVITAGFKETGPKGAALEQQIVEVIRAHGMRMVGPNCMGIINTEPDVRLDSTFAPTVPPRGNIGLVSQSGALGQTILEHADELNLGISMFVSIGNKPDVSGNDLLEYWRDDPSVGVILMYLESFGDPMRFIQLAREVSKKKPIVVVKSGRTVSGARAASSHTGALAGTDVAYDALFKQCGIIRADTINEMFEVAMGLANLPLPRGNRVAIITNAGGPGIMAADACEGAGLQVVPLGRETRETLSKQLPAEASVENPVDLLAGATPEDFQATLQAVLSDEQVDSAIVIFVAPIITDPIAVAAKISAVAHSFDKPVLGCFMGVKGVAPGVEELHRHRIPVYPFPESAARALAAMVRYSRWLRKEPGAMARFDVHEGAAQAVIARVRAERREQLTFSEVAEILRAYGLPVAETVTVRTKAELLDASRKMRYPLVLKVSSSAIIHKSEIGGVRLDLKSEAELVSAFEEMKKTLGAPRQGAPALAFVVQEMIPDGREVIMGLHTVPGFGTLIMFGLGGIHVEVLKDVAFRIVPITDREAEEMISEIKGFAILEGVRGEKPVAFDVLKSALLRLSQLAVDFPEIRELDLNPFMAFPEAEKCRIVDARLRVEV